MSLMLAVDQSMARKIAPLRPHENMFDVNNPGAITSVASMPKPAASTIANWIESPRESAPTPDQVAFLEMLAAC